VPALLKEAEEQLRDKESQEFIHSEIPDAINEIAKQDYQKKTPYDPIEVGGNLLAYDALESVNNVFKRIAEAMLAAGKWSSPFVKGGRKAISEYFQGMGKGAAEYLKKQGPKDGEALVKWGRRLIVTWLVASAIQFKFPFFKWIGTLF